VDSLWCLSTYFNPQKYRSRYVNHGVFRQAFSHPHLIVVELSFGDAAPQLQDARRLRSQSILWQKEKLLNYALSLLPRSCEYVAWIDDDVLMPADWVTSALSRFESGADIVQLFDTVNHLPPGVTQPSNRSLLAEEGIVFQAHTHPTFKADRLARTLPHAATGFAWAARRSILERHGLYDRHILGANDNVFVDAILGTFELHSYFRLGQNTAYLADMLDWASQFERYTIDYVAHPLWHLYHGDRRHRGYVAREEILRRHSYDPAADIMDHNHVYEWASDKEALHREVREYFAFRREDHFPATTG
jgi:hypothetical protein